MKLTLRQARKIESKIKTYLASINVGTVVSLRTNEALSNMYSTLNLAKEQFHKEVEHKRALMNIRHEIRAMIGEANQTSGINKLLTTNVGLVEDIAYLNSLSKISTRLNDMVFTDEVKQKQASLIKGDRYGSSEVTFKSNFLEQKDIKNFEELEHSLTKQLEKNQDAISQLNFSYQITLTESQFKPLQQCKLL